jgi:hypothetical protein
MYCSLTVFNARSFAAISESVSVVEPQEFPGGFLVLVALLPRSCEIMAVDFAEDFVEVDGVAFREVAVEDGVGT